ncbi:tyrosine-type recombinase/integrase [Streptomyces albus]
MPGYIEDRWWTKKPDPATGKKRKTARYGQGKRYRVAGIPGVRDRSFEKLGGPDGAQAWLARAQSESARGEFVDPRHGRILFREYVEDYWWPGQRADVATLKVVRSRVWNHLLPHLGELPLNQIKVPQLRQLITTLEPVLGARTLHVVWGTLSSILHAAVEDERLHKNYCKSRTIRLPPLPEKKARAWSHDQVQRVREAMPPQYRTMVDIGVAAGLRIGEVFGLSVEDVDPSGPWLHVRRQVKKVGSKMCFALPKGGKTRTVPIPHELLSRIERHMAEYPPGDVTLPWGDPNEPTTDKERKDRAPRTHKLLFRGREGGPLRVEGFNQLYWKPALHAAGLIPAPEAVYGGRQVRWKYAEAREHGFHALRHTAASVWLHTRENPVAVSSWLGHADASITLQIYAHMIPEADGRGRAAMGAWLEGRS